MNNVTCQDQADTLLQLWESGNITGNKSDIAILDLLEQLAISHFRDFRISALSTKSSVTATSIVCRLVPDTENWLVSNTGEAAVAFFIEKKLRIFFTFSIRVFSQFMIREGCFTHIRQIFGFLHALHRYLVSSRFTMANHAPNFWSVCQFLSKWINFFA